MSGFFMFFGTILFGKMVGANVVTDIMIEVVVLLGWRSPMVRR